MPNPWNVDRSSSFKPCTSARAFTLRSLAVFVGAISVILAVWTNFVRPQQQLVFEIERLGGEVWNVDFNDRCILDRPVWLPAWTAPVVPRRLNYVYLTGETVGDEHIVLVTRLQPLEGLNISDSRVTDRGLQKLRSCKRLRELQLFDIETVSKSAIDDFRSAVPQCEILR
jgi:hypothetical protein